MREVPEADDATRQVVGNVNEHYSAADACDVEF